MSTVADFWQTWHRVGATMAEEERAWIADLRARGVKAAHPDDGWVDRGRNIAKLMYPQFNDGLGQGDLLALGWPGRETRIVCVMERLAPRWSGERPRFTFVAGDGSASLRAELGEEGE